MASGSRRGALTRLIDDYIEEVAVGTPWWVLVGGFGLGMPIAEGIAALLLHFKYQSGTYVTALFVGVAFGFGLRLIARERERYRAEALDRSGDLQALRKLSWREFEIVIGEALRRNGFPVVKERGGFRADGGIDLIAEGHRRRIAVQCKHWRAWAVSASRVRELYGTVKGGNFTEGWLVTCGAFTSAARSWAAGKELRLIDGKELAAYVSGIALPAMELLRPAAHDAERARDCPNCGAALQRLNNSKDGSQFWGCPSRACGWTFNDPPASPDSVVCDRGHPMVERRTKRGVSFWGCSMYPSCQRKRLISKELSRSGLA
jgi:ssDNA-binding Zn-finger/Zn-ribbon topoisomerase 1